MKLKARLIRSTSSTRVRAMLTTFSLLLPGSASAEDLSPYFRSDVEVVPALEKARIISEYGEDGLWVTESLCGNTICVTKYEMADGVLKEASQHVEDTSSRIIGMRGAQGDVFLKRAASVVLIESSGSLGSGAIIHENGLVVTNRHVVLNAPMVKVYFYDVLNAEGKPQAFRGKVVVVDKVRDLALVQVESPPPGLKPFELEANVKLGPGDEVIAIGHPLGLEWSSTQGTISRVREDFEWNFRFTNNRANVIQFQTPISPGNSGGPLMDKSGNLVGLNSFGKGGQNLNFAIHVSEIKDFVENRDHYSASDIHDWLIASDKVKSLVGIPEQIIVHECDFENDGQPDLLRADRNGNGEWDILFLDVDKDGRFEFVSLDRDEDGFFELLLLDRDNDREPDYVFHGEPILRLPVAVEFIAR